MAKKNNTAGPASTSPVGQFKLGDKTYEIKPTFQKVNIPGIGVLTALEIMASPEAQAYLVNEKCDALIGEVIV